MVICEFGDIAVVPFPFTDIDVVKSRPALVLSNAAFNTANQNTILAMVTSARRLDWPSDVIVTDGEAAGLRRPSRVRMKVFTLPNELIGRRVGALAPFDRAAVTAAIRNQLP